MYLYCNALKNLLRNKGRNILVSVILLVVMTATTVSLSLRSTSEAMIADYQDGFGVETSLNTDWEYAQANAKSVEEVMPDGSIQTSTTFEPETISIGQYMDFADSEYVKEVQFAAFAYYSSNDLEASENGVRFEGMDLDNLLKFYNVSSKEELIQLFGGDSIAEAEVERLLESKKSTIGSIWGYSNASLMSDFRKGEKKITDGRLFENIGEVVISEEFAKKNNLHVGNTISVSGSSMKYDTQPLQLTVVGLFTDIKANLNSGYVELTAGADDLIVSFDTLISGNFHSTSPIMESMKYFLVNAEAPELFFKELRQKGLPESYILDTNVEGYNQIVEPVKKMSSVATTFGIVILLTGATILVFLSIINIRERKYEIGVLRAIGMKKHQLARGMIYESLSLDILCTVIGLPLGGLLAKPISGVLLETADSVSVSLNPAILPLMLMIAALLGILSSLIGILYITRYEPMKILSEQN